MREKLFKDPEGWEKIDPQIVFEFNQRLEKNMKSFSREFKRRQIRSIIKAENIYVNEKRA